MTVGPGRVVIVNAFPLLAQPQGDEGNARVLAHRAELRGVQAEIVTHHSRDRLPLADIYVVGGMEEETVPELALRLRISGLAAAVANGAAVLGVDAGYQVLGRSFAMADGTSHEGLGLLDVVSRWEESEAAGPVVTRPSTALGLPAMSGYESHHGRTTLGSGTAPLAVLELGVGNGDAEPNGTGRAPADPPAPRTDGAVLGRVMGTYLHGPVLARNPELADLLLSWGLGGTVLAEIPARTALAVRAQRIAEDRADPTGSARGDVGTRQASFRGWRKARI